MPITFDELLTVRDVAKLASVTPSTVRGWIRSGRLKALDIGTATNPLYRIKKPTLMAFIGTVEKTR